MGPWINHDIHLATAVQNHDVPPAQLAGRVFLLPGLARLKVAISIQNFPSPFLGRGLRVQEP
jgi:hypothetical protein